MEAFCSLRNSFFRFGQTAQCRGYSPCLPAAGIRLGASVNNAGSFGYYWSSTYFSSRNAYSLYFFSSYMNAQYSYDRNYGRSVRLVQDI